MNVIYIEKWASWYVTERRGNRVVYHGPFYQEATAQWYAAMNMRNRECTDM